MADLDHFAAYYADKLWAMLPAVYRSLDTDSFDENGPLRELVNRIGAQAAILRRNIDRLWEDQSIETCDAWVIPYIGDLLATNLVASLDARGQRLDVAKTIYYRRRAGTVAILEEIASDITGYSARVVEFFRRLGRTRHGFDPEIGLPAESDDPQGSRVLQLAEGLIGPRTRTPLGGWADLRDAYGATQSRTAFDELSHTADFRHGRGQVGWHNIPRLGVFLWRLTSFGVDPTTPVAVSGCPGQFTFDPTGREIPLFCAAARTRDRFGNQWVSPREFELPGPIEAPLLAAHLSDVYADATHPNSLGVFHRPLHDYELVDPAHVKIDPERGRVKVVGGVQAPIFVTYHYGFSSTIGAGPYDRFLPGTAPVPRPDPVVAAKDGEPLAAITGTATLEILDSLTYEHVQAIGGIVSVTVRGASRKRPLVRLPAPSPAVFDWAFTGVGDAALALEGLFISGGDVVLRGTFAKVTISCCTLDPGNVDGRSVDGRTLDPVRLWVEGEVRELVVDRSIVGPIRTRHGGTIEKVVVENSIVQGIRTSGFGPFLAGDFADAGGLATLLKNALDPLAVFLSAVLGPATQAALSQYSSGPPSQVLFDGLVTDLAALVEGPSIFDAQRFRKVRLSPETLALLQTNPSAPPLVTKMNRLLLEDAYPVELGQAALSSHEGSVTLSRSTLLGGAFLHRFDASECILDGRVYVDDAQDGCIRFTAWVSGSILPRKYESVEIPLGAPIFLSRQFGRPEYAQLAAAADAALVAPTGGTISEGAADGSEMGAFARDKNPIKLRSLLIKFEEFMPLGLTPVIIPVT